MVHKCRCASPRRHRYRQAFYPTGNRRRVCMVALPEAAGTAEQYKHHVVHLDTTCFISLAPSLTWIFPKGVYKSIKPSGGTVTKEKSTSTSRCLKRRGVRERTKNRCHSCSCFHTNSGIVKICPKRKQSFAMPIPSFS